TDTELTGGLVSQGVMTMVGAFFGAFPTSTYGQNVGIVTQTRVINRRVFAVAGAILLVAGLAPKLAAILSGIPQPVIGGATINVFGTISMTGIRILSKDGLTPRRATIAGLSLALGMGITMTSNSLAGPGMPAFINEVFGHSAIVVAALSAIILNLVLPKGGPDKEVVKAVEGAAEVQEEAVGALYKSAATGVPAVEHKPGSVKAYKTDYKSE
ncbi:MAG: purine permease, partial [Atopobium sp.]|nr:purine permease [Atopobium sp.]